MNIRKNKQPPTQRSPHIVRQKQSSFQYSSNRSQAERTRDRSSESFDEAKRHAERAAVYMRRFAQLPYILGALFCFAAIVYLSTLSAAPRIKITGDQDTIVRDTAAYSSSAADLTSGVTSRSKFTINRQKISDELIRSYPEIQSAAVTTPLFGRALVVSLVLAPPQLLLTSGSQTYVLDNRGIAIIDITSNRPTFKTDGLPLITDDSNTAIAVGKPALTSVQVAYITELSHQSAAKQLTIESMNMVSGGGELIVRYADTPYYVRYSLNEDARKSFGTFIATREFIDQKKTPPAEYIDVRIPERAYVK